MQDIKNVISWIFDISNEILNLISQYLILKLLLIVPIVCIFIYSVYCLFLDNSGVEYSLNRSDKGFIMSDYGFGSAAGNFKMSTLLKDERRRSLQKQREFERKQREEQREAERKQREQKREAEKKLFTRHERVWVDSDGNAHVNVSYNRNTLLDQANTDLIDENIYL